MIHDFDATHGQGNTRTMTNTQKKCEEITQTLQDSSRRNKLPYHKVLISTTPRYVKGKPKQRNNRAALTQCPQFQVAASAVLGNWHYCIWSTQLIHSMVSNTIPAVKVTQCYLSIAPIETSQLILFGCSDGARGWQLQANLAQMAAIAWPAGQGLLQL